MFFANSPSFESVEAIVDSSVIVPRQNLDFTEILWQILKSWSKLKSYFSFLIIFCARLLLGNDFNQLPECCLRCFVFRSYSAQSKVR